MKMEKSIYKIGFSIISTVCVVVGACFYRIPVKAKFICHTCQETNSEEVVDEYEKTDLNGNFECCTSFYEPIYYSMAVDEGLDTYIEECETTTDCVSAVENSEEETECESVEVYEETHSPVLSINGSVLREDIRDYYYSRLSDFGIEWWYEYGLCQMYQESGFNIYEENVNGLDKGLLQYRTTFWVASLNYAGLTSGDIFDPFTQIYVYTFTTYNRLCSGMSVNEVISAHNTGGYGYNQDYVNQVLQWMYVR